VKKSQALGGGFWGRGEAVTYISGAGNGRLSDEIAGAKGYSSCMDQNRRTFLKGVAAVPAVAAAAFEPAEPRFNGIQIGPFSLYDEGIDHCLDFLQSTAGINCLMLYSHTYHGDVRKATQILASDHGVPLKPLRGRKFPAVWVRTHEEFYKNTTLRHQAVDSSFEFSNRDLFTEVREPARKRGMKLYARILEGTGLGQIVANFSKIVTQNIYGQPTHVPCWNHPEYRAWWTGTAEDLFRTYDLDGLQWGAERMGPLMNVISPWNNDPPTCFCQFCEERGREHGIDPKRARQGFEELFRYAQGRINNEPKPADGIFTGFLRVLLRYPEILSWEYQYRQGREDMQRAIYNTVKAIKPTAEVGWHIDHQPSSWDLVYRAEMTLAEMAPYSDFIKPILYHDILGPRIRNWYLPRFQKTILGELSLEQSLDLYYALFGYDKNVEPKLDELNTKGFSPDYVYRETKRCKGSAEGKTKIYPGIGFDVPSGNNTMPGNPETVYECVRKAFAAGADGIVVSREYEEMRAANLKAVGRAMRELNG
jgi:hypothetical protein